MSRITHSTLPRPDTSLRRNRSLATVMNSQNHRMKTKTAKASARKFAKVDSTENSIFFLPQAVLWRGDAARSAIDEHVDPRAIDQETLADAGSGLRNLRARVHDRVAAVQEAALDHGIHYLVAVVVQVHHDLPALTWNRPQRRVVHGNHGHRRPCGHRHPA